MTLFLAGLTGWSKSTPTCTGAHTITRLCTRCQKKKNPLRNICTERECMCGQNRLFDQTNDTDGLCQSPASCPKTGVYTRKILRSCDVYCADIMLLGLVQFSFSGKHTDTLISYLYSLYIIYEQNRSWLKVFTLCYKNNRKRCYWKETYEHLWWGETVHTRKITVK